MEERKFIPVQEAFARWRKNPNFVAAYDALEEEFALASAIIKDRGEGIDPESNKTIARTQGHNPVGRGFSRANKTTAATGL